ncbi:MAG: tRNA (cytidine(34)-2'-O)-methyltransferase [Lachnospiraceae bacterium]|nr:tRNA (cytidine(34)-2'-O)-methyltransferase [Lachnospiraceae bacterium]
MFNVVLLEPEKPDNTGNIGRTCVATGSALHLIYPIGFQLTRKNIHHAGLDYWDRLKIFKHDNYDEFVRFVAHIVRDDDDHIVRDDDDHIARDEAVGANACGARSEPVVWYATTKAHKSYTDVKYNDGDYIVFGKESAGIPEEILSKDEEHCIRIPMIENERSLNLSNSVAIVLYEALRQNNFNGMLKKGELHRLSYKH